MLYITGDVHFPIDSAKIAQLYYARHLTVDDIVIILGDMGIIWSGLYEDNLWRCKWFEQFPCTFLFVDGNHENHEVLSKMRRENKFGSRVGVICSNVYHLLRGNVYTIMGKKFFTMGGALSIDKHLRMEHISWWSEEQPSAKEYSHALETLDKNGYCVDYILTHTCPFEIKRMLGYMDMTETETFLSTVATNCDFRHWFFGHFHEDREIPDKYTCLYNGIRSLDVDTGAIEPVHIHLDAETEHAVERDHNNQMIHARLGYYPNEFRLKLN